MKIGLDARWIFHELSGIGLYTQELIRHMARLDLPLDVALFFTDPALRDRTWTAAELHDKPRFHAEMLPWGVFSPWSQILLPARLKRAGVCLFHSPNYMIPFAAFPRGGPRAIRCVVTVHDLIPLLFPHFTPRALKTRFHPLFRRILIEAGARADALLTVSETSRADILRHLRIPAGREDRVIAIPNGVAEDYQPGPHPPAGAQTMLYVGRFDPYKNVPGLLEAFRLVRDRSPREVRLRIIGSPDPRYPEAAQRAKALGLEGAVDWTGYADGPALAAAYRAADVFVLLSRYEGFGLTVLEAMASGTPVVCSRIGALAEIAGEAAALVDPHDPEAAAAAILRVLEDAAYADDLRRKGLKHAARFSWMNTARQTLRVYQDLLAP